MQRLRRTRQASLPLGRVRRSPRMADSETALVVTLQVSTEVVSGAVSEEALLGWLKDAVSRYHTFRAGLVGYSADAGIRPPELELVCPDE